jgi:hypothetical protein
MVMRLLGIAGVVVHLRTDMLGQVRQLITAAAATGRTAAALSRFTCRLTYYRQLHHRVS